MATLLDWVHTSAKEVKSTSVLYSIHACSEVAKSCLWMGTLAHKDACTLAVGKLLFFGEGIKYKHSSQQQSEFIQKTQKQGTVDSHHPQWEFTQMGEKNTTNKHYVLKEH